MVQTFISYCYGRQAGTQLERYMAATDGAHKPTRIWNVEERPYAGLLHTPTSFLHHHHLLLLLLLLLLT